MHHRDSTINMTMVIIITTINMTMVIIILAHFAAIEVTDSIVHLHPTLLVPVQPSNYLLFHHIFDLIQFNLN